MHLLLLMIMVAHPRQIEIIYYQVFSEIKENTQWMIKGDRGYYICTAETSCPDMGEGAEIISGRKLFYDPILLFYHHDGKRKRCMMESCVRPKPLTYDDL